MENGQLRAFTAYSRHATERVFDQATRRFVLPVECVCVGVQEDGDAVPGPLGNSRGWYSGGEMGSEWGIARAVQSGIASPCVASHMD